MLDIILKAFFSLLPLWKKVLAYMFLFFLVAETFITLKLYRKLNRTLRPVGKMANLKEETISSIVLFFLNPDASRAAFAKFNREGIITDKEVIISQIITQFPFSVYDKIVFFVPVALSAFGVMIGGFYLSLELFIDLVIAGVGVYIGKKMLKVSEAYEGLKPFESRQQGKVNFNVFNIFKNIVKPYCKTAAIFLSMSLFVEILMDFDAFKVINYVIEPLFDFLNLPPEAAVVVLAGSFMMITGFAAAGPIFAKGILTPTQLIFTLLITRMVKELVSYFVNRLPMYVSFFGPRLGFRFATARLIVLQAVYLAASILFFWLFL